MTDTHQQFCSQTQRLTYLKISIYSYLLFKIPHVIDRALLIISDRDLTSTTAKNHLLEMPLSLISAGNLTQIILMNHLAFTWLSSLGLRHSYKTLCKSEIQNICSVHNRSFFAALSRPPDTLCCHPLNTVYKISVKNFTGL